MVALIRLQHIQGDLCTHANYFILYRYGLGKISKVVLFFLLINEHGEDIKAVENRRFELFTIFMGHLVYFYTN